MWSCCVVDEDSEYIGGVVARFGEDEVEGKLGVWIFYEDVVFIEIGFYELVVDVYC